MEQTEQAQPEPKPQVIVEKRHNIPVATLRRMLRENGIERITKDALDEIAMMLQDIVRDISNNAVVFTKHGKRKTTNKDDILLAMK